ncbi:fibroblast growth factor receptor 2-like [Actinia tenebrosa]|uniref:Fibroblast growth factor receptor 2-like n=1 Tax=Actinia tenebrosa TaxID=6105 RepID=A0A6P8IVM6_ACTTE|nr:fibroblast growth factor receptor 2-like [Actinia tenebrosa]XP_031570166.1 fibroblast growth factor receptor 2-like [Actinia tenebrosa]XP_031570167.1 fibroblast growth factor receptor 2-like [Actinia tenebrosa]
MVYCIGLCVMTILNCLSCTAGVQSDRLRPSHPTTKVVATVGSTARLNCSAVATQKNVSIAFKWFKYGRPLLEVTSRRRDSIFRLGRHVLVFDEVLLADAGRYMCMRITGHKTENWTFNLSVKEPREHPIIVDEPQGNMSTTLGQTAILSCKIQTQSITYIEWRFLQSIPTNTSRNISMKESFITPSTKIVPTKLRLRVVVPLLLDGASGSRRTTVGERRQIHEDLLYIYNVSSNDSGTYICLAFNKYGKAIKETTLTISAAQSTKPSCVPRSLAADDSNIPIAILIAIPAFLFFLACTVIIRALEKARQQKKLAKLAKAEKEREKEQKQEKTKDIIQSKSSLTDINENRPVAMVTAQNFRPVHVIDERIRAFSTDEQRFDSISTSSASEVEVVLTDNKLANQLSLSKQSSLPSSTDIPYTSPTPDLVSSSSCGVELDWEGMDLNIPDGIELVELSREAEV